MSATLAFDWDLFAKHVVQAPNHFPSYSSALMVSTMSATVTVSAQMGLAVTVKVTHDILRGYFVEQDAQR